MILKEQNLSGRPQLSGNNETGHKKIRDKKKKKSQKSLKNQKNTNSGNIKINGGSNGSGKSANNEGTETTGSKVKIGSKEKVGRKEKTENNRKIQSGQDTPNYQVVSKSKVAPKYKDSQRVKNSEKDKHYKNRKNKKEKNEKFDPEKAGGEPLSANKYRLKKTKFARFDKNKKSARDLKSSSKSKLGTLIIVGGREDKAGDMRILREIVRCSNSGKMVIATVASDLAKEVWHEYKSIFRQLGVKEIEHLQIGSPEEARNPQLLRLFDGAQTVFFTGGDQLKITSKIGGTQILDRIFEIFHQGGVIAGTSAGAAMMGETMLVGNEISDSHRVGDWMMAPGIGFVHNMIIDQHFAQRGRIARLLRAVALNPSVLGIGIDEDTAVVIRGQEMRVIGANAVCVVDGRHVTYTNICEAAASWTMSMHDVHLHILAEDETFNLIERIPMCPPY